MKIYNGSEQNFNIDNDNNKSALALGFFDGVHIGHRAVISSAKEYAESKGIKTAVFTFKNGKSQNELIYTVDKKNLVLEECGVDISYEPDFEKFCGLSPEEFFEKKLINEYSAKALFCGWDFKFGKNRAGDAQLLKKLALNYGVDVFILPPSLYKGKEVSSSLIREYIKNGQFEDVNEMLAKPYGLESEVVHGEKLGSSFGFPTINQNFPNEVQKPKYGVYVSKTYIDGKAYPSATGYGVKPTLKMDKAEESCETFIPGFSGNLYGQSIKVELYKYISESKMFESMDELASAVQKWANIAVKFFN